MPPVRRLSQCSPGFFARFGNPKVLLSDNGPQFTSEEFESFLKLNGIQHCKTSPYAPKANSQVERFHRYLEHSIRAAELEGFLCTEVLPDILQVYRSTPHAGTGMTPATLMLNREITTKSRKKESSGKKDTNAIKTNYEIMLMRNDPLLITLQSVPA